MCLVLRSNAYHDHTILEVEYKKNSLENWIWRFYQMKKLLNCFPETLFAEVIIL